MRVGAMFGECTYRRVDAEHMLPAIAVQSSVAYYPDLLEARRADIVAMLDELPDGFRERGPGLQLKECQLTRSGRRWTNADLLVEWLMMLAIGLDLVEMRVRRVQEPPDPSLGPMGRFMTSPTRNVPHFKLKGT
jgi:hypothetical protein